MRLATMWGQFIKLREQHKKPMVYGTLPTNQLLWLHTPSPMFHLLHLLCVMARFSAVSHATLMTSRSSRGLLLLLHTPARLTTAVWYSKCCMRKDYIYSQVGFKKKKCNRLRGSGCAALMGFTCFVLGFFFAEFAFIFQMCHFMLHLYILFKMIRVPYGGKTLMYYTLKMHSDPHSPTKSQL